MKDLVSKGTRITQDLADFEARLQPGDIIVTKPGQSARWSPLTSAIRTITRSPWSHAGIYAGGGEVLHTYPDIHKGRVLEGSAQQLRRHSLKQLKQINRDMHAIRPNVSPEKRLAAVKRMTSMRGLPQSYKGLLRAGFLPSRDTSIPKEVDAATCSGALALAYPTLDYRAGRSKLHVRPSDFVNYSLGKGVAALKTAGYIDTLRRLGLSQ